MPKPIQRGAITFGDLAGRLEVLRVVCAKCDRSGRYSVAKLIERHGGDMGLPDFRDLVAVGCPVRTKPGTWEPCQAGFPDLQAVLYGR